MNRTTYLLTFGLGLLLFLSAASLQHKGLTCDEPAHFDYGLRVLHGDTTRNNDVDNSKMPFSAWNALVSLGGGDSKSQALRGRAATIFFLLLLAGLVFFWSRELYGTTPAFFSFFLFCLDPNLIAHGQLVTTDLYGALTMTASFYFFWRFLTYGGWSRAIVSAVILGVSQLAKYTSVSFYTFFLVIAVFKFLPELLRMLKAGEFNILKVRVWKFIQYILLFMVVSLLIINIGFCFNRLLVPLKDYQFESHSFQSLQSVPVLRSIPVPVPYPFIQGMDMCKFADDSGTTFPNTYLLGQIHEGYKGNVGFKGYFFVAMLYKVPIATLLIILMALGAYFFRRSYSSFWQKEVFLLLPVVFFLIYYDFFINMNIGIRHILFVFPLLYIFCGSLFVPWKKYSAWIKGGFLALMLYLAVSVFSYFPHFISYFNELVMDRKMAYKILADSNIDWGGNEWYLDQYLKAHPESIVSPDKPTAGHIIVRVNELDGIPSRLKYQWLRDNFKPVDQIAYSYLVFDVSHDQLVDLMVKSMLNSPVMP